MNNKEFLFIYDAALCNPNGDPDQENKPRMDKTTKTNLVSDTRLKRYIRDYLIDHDKDVFVSMMGGEKVSVEDRLNAEIELLKNDESAFNRIIESDRELKALLDSYKSSIQEYKTFNYLQIFLQADESKSKSKDAKVKKEEDDFLKSNKGKINNFVLMALIRNKFIDIRYFGGAFAVGGYSRTITGPIQINFGYSLHPVELNPSNTIVTIMGDKGGQSGIGKKETLFYSLIAFTGTINSQKADIVNLSDKDIEDFREAMIQSLYHIKSDSKKNQFPRLYLEIEYRDRECSGRLGDLRNHISVKSKVKNSKGETDFTGVRSLKDIEVDFSELEGKITKLKDKISEVRVWISEDETFNIFDSSSVNKKDFPKITILNI
jgi:CRISPR-associated protein Csh2